jgi:putative transposase
MRGYDAGKKVKGRKRHIAVDTLGLVWARVVHEAGIQDRDGAKLVFLALMSILTTLFLVWADQGYAGHLVEWVKNHHWGWQLDSVKKLEGISGFHLLPHRWIVERTFAWYGNYRLLAKEYEYSSKSSEADLDLAMRHLMLRRLRL